MMNRPANDAGPDVRLRTMRILWAVFLAAVGLFFLVTRLSRPRGEAVAGVGAGDTTLLSVLAAVGLSSVVASYVLKASFYKRAAEQQQPAVLQTGFVVAMALCEVAVLLGLAGFFMTWNDYAYGLFVLGGLGEALHFPRRAQVMSAYFRPGM
jgi:F0F1-type ATP synthase membrane subunit c/vacuolar-type H+-ATPase subunit K